MFSEYTDDGDENSYRIRLVLVCCDEARPVRPPSSHLDKRPAPVLSASQRVEHSCVSRTRVSKGDGERIPPKAHQTREKKKKGECV